MTKSPDFSAFAKSNQALPPRHLGRRYDTSGTFLHESGNTVVSHVTDNSQCQRALVALRDRMQALPGADRLAFTPVSSLHMTIFQGIIEFRREVPYWPEDVPLDTAIADMTALFDSRLERFTPPPAFSVGVVAATPNGVELAGISDKDNQALANWRDALADCFGYRHPDHDTYRLHITFAYLIDWLEDDDIPLWRAALEDGVRELQTTVPVIELDPPAFCSFEDMCAFPQIRVLV